MNEFTIDQAAQAGPLDQLIPILVWTAVFIAVVLILMVVLKRYVHQKKQKDIFLRNRDVPSIVRNISGFDFEIWVKELLLTLGIKAEVTPQRGDHGIDVIAYYNGKRIGIQCKKYYGTKFVGEPVLRDLYGVKHADGYDKVAVITTGNFSYEAQAWAKNKPDLILINAKLLERIIVNRELLRQLLK